VPSAVRWGLGDVVWGLFLFFVGQLLMGAVAAVILVVTGNEDGLLDGETPLLLVALSIVGGWLGLVGWPLVATYRKGQRSLRKDFGFTANWGDVGWGLVGGIGCLALSVALSLLWALFVGDDPPSNGQFLDDSGSGPLVFLLLFVLIGVATPIAEELFFRGLFLRSLGKRWNIKVAVVASSVVFGLMHATAGTSIGGGLFIAAVTGAYGFVLALLAAWRNGRLGAPITAHMVINGVQVIAVFALGMS
jgi:membrane protease YdiL (CAAX protease family)